MGRMGPMAVETGANMPRVNCGSCESLREAGEFRTCQGCHQTMCSGCHEQHGVQCQSIPRCECCQRERPNPGNECGTCRRKLCNLCSNPDCCRCSAERAKASKKHQASAAAPVIINAKPGLSRLLEQGRRILQQKQSCDEAVDAAERFNRLVAWHQLLAAVERESCLEVAAALPTGAPDDFRKFGAGALYTVKLNPLGLDATIFGEFVRSEHGWKPVRRVPAWSVSHTADSPELGRPFVESFAEALAIAERLIKQRGKTP